MSHGVDLLKLGDAAGTFARGVIILLFLMSLWSLSVAIAKMIMIWRSQAGHLGLTPQAINKFGTYEVRAQDPAEAQELLRDARVLEKAGVFAIVLEKIPSDLPKKVTKSVSVPTIGIGAGPHCDGQVLVVYDMLGLTEEFQPRFVRRYEELAGTMRKAFTRYIGDVRAGRFPSKGESLLMAARRPHRKKPSILVSNDDGIDAPGIYALVHEIRKIAEVTVVAPDRQQSAVGHAKGHNRLMLTKAIDLSARLKRAVSLPILPGDEKRTD